MNQDHPPASNAENSLVGLIAGRGRLPLECCRAARRAGVGRIAIIALHGETSDAVVAQGDTVDWAYPGQLRRAITCLKRRGVEKVLFAGQIRPSRLWRGLRPDLKALKILWSLRERNAETLFSAVANEFEKAGIHVLPSTQYMQDYLSAVGVMGSVKPGRSVRRDIEFGCRIAREISRLDIGQTVVVKRGTVLAVEGFEGTDHAIRRGGSLGHGGAVVVKVAKPNHDLRFDVPCIGMGTVAALRDSKANALAVQAGMSLFLERDAVLKACDEAGIAVVGIEPS